MNFRLVQSCRWRVKSLLDANERQPMCRRLTHPVKSRNPIGEYSKHSSWIEKSALHPFNDTNSNAYAVSNVPLKIASKDAHPERLRACNLRKSYCTHGAIHFNDVHILCTVATAFSPTTMMLTFVKSKPIRERSSIRKRMSNAPIISLCLKVWCRTTSAHCLHTSARFLTVLAQRVLLTTFERMIGNRSGDRTTIALVRRRRIVNFVRTICCG